MLKAGLKAAAIAAAMLIVGCGQGNDGGGGATTSSTAGARANTARGVVTTTDTNATTITPEGETQPIGLNLGSAPTVQLTASTAALVIVVGRSESTSHITATVDGQSVAGDQLVVDQAGITGVVLPIDAGQQMDVELAGVADAVAVLVAPEQLDLLKLAPSGSTPRGITGWLVNWLRGLAWKYGCGWVRSTAQSWGYWCPAVPSWVSDVGCWWEFATCAQRVS